MAQVQDRTATDARAVAGVVDLGIKAATAYGRPDLAARLTSLRQRLDRSEVHVFVIGDYKMGKSTIFRSEHVMVGLNAFEPGQEHTLHTHAGMDKVYHVIEGQGLFLLEAGDVPMRAGVLLVAPEGVPHGIRNTGAGRLLVLTILAPAP